MIAGAALVLLLCAPPTARAEAEPVPTTLDDGRYLMGTVLEVTLRAADSQAARELLERVFARTAKLEAVLTRFDPQSDLSRLNRSAGGGPRRVDPDLARILDLAIRYGRLTGGAFDVTVGPLVDLWREAAATGRRPDAPGLERARARVGVERLHADPASRTAELLATGVTVDLGGIAKGFALDRAGALLERAGVEAALLSFGQSSLQALGSAPGGAGWRVLLRDASDGFAGVVTLRDQALSVSGSLGQLVEIDGRRYGHVIDPRSGEPLTRRRVAAVVAASGARAEALSKALLVLGESEGVALLERLPNAEGILLDAGGERWSSSGWSSAVSWEPLRAYPPNETR